MISNSSKYAIRAAIYLSLYSSEKHKVGIREISKNLSIPSPFLGKILQVLGKHGILLSTKGPHGGFALRKSPYDITLMEIVEIMEGHDVFDLCVIRTTKCSEGSPCSLHDKISPLRNDIKLLFKTQTIADLASEFRHDRSRIKI
ncbi:MAG: Rrf2 family transcriptional regulator [Bacteroidales bacterium]|nr:Rrf2 family transcriptional regulator [Bacteroidales bacterium]MBN2699075.1 Rrf2 family transcriptional regulator [Bacteroidales bacterium]